MGSSSDSPTAVAGDKGARSPSIHPPVLSKGWEGCKSSPNFPQPLLQAPAPQRLHTSRGGNPRSADSPGTQGEEGSAIIHLMGSSRDEGAPRTHQEHSQEL